MLMFVTLSMQVSFAQPDQYLASFPGRIPVIQAGLIKLTELKFKVQCYRYVHDKSLV